MNTSRTTTIFVKGLLFTLPIVLTISIIVWFVENLNSFLSKPLWGIVPAQYQFPGMGIVFSIVIIYFIGLLIHGRILNFLFQWTQRLLSRLPLVSAVYNNIKEMIDFVSGEKDEEIERVVLVTMDGDLKLLGLVTQQDSDIKDSEGNPLRAVYLPMSYQMGGYLVYVPESRLENLDISKREAMTRVLTADISSTTAEDKNKAKAK